MFDRNHVPITSDPTQSNFQRITTGSRETGTDVAHDSLVAQVIVKQPGYMYIYLSNEEPTSSPIEVYFDDFKVTQIKSPVISTNSYYPFGLTFDSYQRENSVANQFQYNSKELQDELNLGWINYGARMYMPEIGRWTANDPASEEYFTFSPYNYVRNSLIVRVDQEGKWDITVHVFNDRTQYGYGVAIVTDRNGNEVFRFAVRAQGVGGNNRMNQDADSPLGVYDIPNTQMWMGGESESVKNRNAYGPNPRLILVEESGEILESGRDLLRMHGGRQEVYDPITKEWSTTNSLILEKTRGCFRVFDTDMIKLKEVTDNLMVTDPEELGGKVTVKDDLKKENVSNVNGNAGYSTIYTVPGDNPFNTVEQQAALRSLIQTIINNFP